MGVFLLDQILVKVRGLKHSVCALLVDLNEIRNISRKVVMPKILIQLCPPP